MQSFNDATKQGKTIATKVAAGYATYQAATKTAKQVAEVVCHTYTIDGECLPNLYASAVKIVREHSFDSPFQRRKIMEQESLETNRYRNANWVFVRIPGIKGVFQARAAGYMEIQFRSPLKSSIEALREYIDEMAEDDINDLTFDSDIFDFPKTTGIMAWNKNGWQFRKNRPARSFKSVFLPEELQAEIEDDMKAFIDSHDRLTRLEMPWRRGYLFAGPPGTGKTSLSLAIAGSLDFSLASLSLTDITSDGMLREAVSQLQPRTVLVIEDIDAYSVSHSRDHNTAKDGALSLSGLLNSLDGFETPEGLVTIATTNHPEQLDEALIRSGRLDRTFTLDHIADAELERLFKWFYEEDAPADAPRNTIDANISPAEVAELFKQHLNDPQGGWSLVLDTIATRTHHLKEVAA